MTDKEKIAQLEKEKAGALKEAETAKEERAKALEEAEAAKEETKVLKTIVEPMAKELEELKSQPNASKVPTGTFKYKNVEYGFNFPTIIFPGKGEITAGDILKDKGLQARLVEIGSGMLRKIKK